MQGQRSIHRCELTMEGMAATSWSSSAICWRGYRNPNKARDLIEPEAGAQIDAAKGIPSEERDWNFRSHLLAQRQ